MFAGEGYPRVLSAFRQLMFFRNHLAIINRAEALLLRSVLFGLCCGRSLAMAGHYWYVVERS